MQMAALYASITRSIIDDLEKGVPAWVQPWRTKRRTALGLLPANLATGRTYSGINIPILWHAAKSAGYPDPAWMTYRQALALDANVRTLSVASTIMDDNYCAIGEAHCSSLRIKSATRSAAVATSGDRAAPISNLRPSIA